MTMSKRVSRVNVEFADGSTKEYQAREGFVMETKTYIEQDGAKPVEVRQVTVSLALDWSIIDDATDESDAPKSIPEKGEAANGIND